jgi:hypothetical protein
MLSAAVVIRQQLLLIAIGPTNSWESLRGMPVGPAQPRKKSTPGFFAPNFAAGFICRGLPQTRKVAAASACDPLGVTRIGPDARF